MILVLFVFSASTTSSFALLQEAGTISAQAVPGQKTVFAWLIQSDEQEPITVHISSEGDGSEFLSFEESAILQPNQIMQIPITILIPPDYSGPLMLNPTLVATQLGQSGGPTIINLQLAKTINISVDVGAAQILDNAMPVEPSQITDSAEPAQVTGQVTIEPKSGCLIATATFGTELAPQVQLLRELRDNVLLGTNSGTTFLAGFNEFYYFSSPAISDLERHSPIFRDLVKMAITPMLSTLSILQFVDIDSEQKMLGYGIGIILLNAGIYFVLPGLIIYKLRKSDRLNFLP